MEHRLATRIPVTLQAVLKSAGEPAIFGRVRNLSRHGAHLELPTPPPRHRLVELQLSFPDKGKRRLPKGFVFTAIVVWNRASEVGLEFCEDYPEIDGLLHRLTEGADTFSQSIGQAS